MKERHMGFITEKMNIHVYIQLQEFLLWYKSRHGGGLARRTLGGAMRHGYGR